MIKPYHLINKLGLTKIIFNVPCRGKPLPPMGPRGPSLFLQGDVALHKEQKNVGQYGIDHMSNFTQVQAAARCKTLLLLWWIDGGKVVVEHSTLARQARPGEAVTTRVRAWGCSTFQPLLRLPWASFYRLRGHHSGKTVIMH
jgi:hypothetical protein